MGASSMMPACGQERSVATVGFQIG